MPVLYLQIFAASILADSEGLAAAFRTLESCLAGPDTPLDLIVQDLCSVPYLFEFIISVFPSAKGLVRRILDAYPTDPALVEASFASMLLRRLSSVFFALPPGLYSSDAIDVGRSKFFVENALPVLALLCSTDLSCYFATHPPIHTPEDSQYGNKAFSESIKKQKGSRRKNKNTALAFDLTPFHKLGAKVPLNSIEAAQMADEISRELRTVLKLYLELLRGRSLAPRLRHAYFSTGDSATVCPPSPQEAKFAETVESKPSAYPKVQPMKAALYFENADGFGEWRIIIGMDATKKLRELANGDRKKCAIVVKKIKQLSNGHFSDDNQKRLNGSTGIPVFEAKMQRDLRLVYQVDVVPDHDGEVERQVIKIYGIYTHTQLNRIWDAVGQHLAGKGKEYRRRCIFRTPPMHGSHGDVYLPAFFPPEIPQSDTKPVPLVLSDDDKEELHSLLVLEKYVTFSQAFLHSLVLDQDVQHVFELTTQERRIVECTTSCYVIGRSGTGYGRPDTIETLVNYPSLRKTTTMLFKMLGIQRAWEMQRTSGLPKPRQIFVTKSRVLAAKVQEYFMKLLESLALAGYSLEELKGMQTRRPELGLVDVDDIAQVDIPRRYSALEDNHFPLFVTFDKLAKMIAADVLSGDDPEAQRLANFFITVDEVNAKDSFITYDVFARTYWPHLPQPLTKGLEPWSVFSEFMGIIKGSEKSLWCPDGFLDEEAYCNLSARSNPVFANQRQTVYAIFEAYCKLKKDRHHHDVADRTHAILKKLLGGTQLRGQKVDFLYVDEAQDNLLIDALLLRLICQNPEGLFWAGDTAQTISAGSSFRFNDLKAFIYRIEQDHSTHLIQDRSVTDPMAFQLAINYRSHGGIVNCAHTVIERITYFWPDAIDNLQPECGIVDGSKPVFFRSWDQDTIRKELFPSNESGDRIELGARQCILVRDEEARQKFRKGIGRNINLMIITLYESKGLEFDNVLLYNFFEDSAVDALRWRVLLNDSVGKIDGQDLAKTHAPSFGRDEGRFTGVCSELKSLYVGITRARKNLWIFDRSDKSEPMRTIWTSRNQVQNYTPGMDVARLAVSSTMEEWESFGYDLFKHKRYPQAKHCFSQAAKPRIVAICEAFHLREVARAQVGVATLKVQQEAFFTAANAFVASAKDAPVGEDKLQYYHNAADCYVCAGYNHKAANAYLDAQEYGLAARRYWKAGLSEKTLEVLHNHSKEIPSEISKELFTACRLFYCSKHDSDTVRPHLPLFSSFDEENEFLEEYNLDFARATLLENHGKYLEAAELHLAKGRSLNAIRNFLKVKGLRNAIQRATRVVLDVLWRRCSFGITSRQVAADQDVKELLELASELPVDFLDPLDRCEISMFRSIAQADLTALGELSREFDRNREAPALLALDHFFSRLPALKSYKLHEMSLFLETFQTYATMLHRIFSHVDPLSVHWIKHLFCIKEVKEASETSYTLDYRSRLHSAVSSDYGGSKHFQGPVLTLSKREVVLALREYLANHLYERVTMENDLCYEAVVFSPCLDYIVNRQCNQSACPLDHVNSLDLDARYYNLRVKIHLQQICILQCMYYANPYIVRERTVVDWLVHLYEAFNPQFHIQGSMADLDLSMIPKEGWSVMKKWVREALCILDEHHDPEGLLTTALKLMNLSFVFDKSNAFQWINRAHFITKDIKPPEFMYSGGFDGIKDLLSFYYGATQTSVSAGLRFLRHVLKQALTVNLSVFCDCFEEVVGRISVSWRLSDDPPLDGLVLPRSWLSSNKDFARKKNIEIPLLLDLLDNMRDLLVLLQSGSANDRYVLLCSRLTSALCNVFTSRICRALCLLVHNVRNADVTLSVKNTLNALRTAEPHFSFQMYTLAEPNDYLRVIMTYDAGVVIQDLVQLIHKRMLFRRPLRLPRLTHIRFENPLDIPSLVNRQLVKAYSSLRADAAVFVRRASQNEMAKKPIAGETLPEEPEPEATDDGHEGSQELPQAVDEPALICAHEPTEEETKAAEKIQAAYRAYCKRREARASVDVRGLKARINIVFFTCLKNTLGWKKNTYRTLYLWALPHLVVCLDEAIAIVSESKSKTKCLLLTGSREHFEEVVERTNRINALLKEGRELRKTIEPNAAMHQRKDKTVLKQVASDIKDFITNNSEFLAPSNEARKSCEFAWELVVSRAQPARKERPTLNTEDL